MKIISQGTFVALGIKKSKVHSAPAHADEKWLVSYSDLMTLLFGFFVLMYSLASENKGKTEDVLEGISKQMRGISSEEKKDPQAEIADLKKKIDEYKKEFLALDKINNDQLEEIDRLKTSLAEIDKEKKKLESTLPDPSRSKDQSSLIDKLNKEIERLKKAYADLFAKSQIWIFCRVEHGKT
jgi:flagellar motor protein MotB